MEEALAEGDQVAARFTWRGTHRGEFQGLAATGKPVTGAGISVLRVTNGKIAEDIVQEDMLGLLQQLGAIPAPGEAPAGR